MNYQLDSNTELNEHTEFARNTLIKKLSPRRRHIMKRCFMTGKQCIFSHYISEELNPNLSTDCTVEPELAKNKNIAERYTSQISKISSFLEKSNVFVIMPFSPNLETFYRWSLRPYLLSGYGFKDKNVQRADDVREIGYIVCEKICRQIQEADLILADVSLKNSNVFYELGLTFGLERPYVLMQGGKINEDILEDVCIRQSLSLHDKAENEKDPILAYPGVGALDLRVDDHRLHKFMRRPPVVRPRRKLLEISILRVIRPLVQVNSSDDEQGLSRLSKQGLDIGLEFSDVLKGAIGVAMAEIRSDIESTLHSNDPWVQVVKQITRKEWFEFSEAQVIEVNGKGGFDSIARAIESSFATIIDVSGNDPVAYFWLGYCHSRGLNAIPVYRTGSAIVTDKFNPDKKIESKLAFDIHALWYAEYDETKPYNFKTKIREILEHLFQRDLPDRQKRAFWNRFPAEHKLKVFTGAIHVSALNREMIGDWDLRTVSELFSYLPSVREAMAIELVTPIYSPEQAFNRYLTTAPKSETKNKTKTDIKNAFLKEYLSHLEDQLNGINAIVIASPDVNPITEFLLHEIYTVKNPRRAFEAKHRTSFNGFVVVKQVKPEKRESEEQLEKFPRLFYREALSKDFRKAYSRTEEIQNLRGFGIHAQTHLFMEDALLFEPYVSQDDCKAPFSLLGHLVIARYPRDKEANLVVLLNGVSGPATFALAQILTGGGVRGTHEMNAQSEILLEKINTLLDDPNCLGVEAIVKVEIVPAAGYEKQTYLDSRQVKKWNFLINTIPKNDQDENKLNIYGPKELKI